MINGNILVKPVRVFQGAKEPKPFKSMKREGKTREWQVVL